MANQRQLDGWTAKEQGKFTNDFTFVQMADTQFGFLKENISWQEELDMTNLAIDYINKIRPKFAIVCGDLVHAFPHEKQAQAAQVADFKKAFARVDPAIALVCLCGNHDVGNAPTPETIDLFKSRFGDDYFSFWAAGVKCLVLNTSLYHTPKDAQELADAQHVWLLDELRKSAEEAPAHIFAFGHIPPFIENRQEGLGYFNWPQETRAKVLDPMKAAGVRAFFCGHYHRNAGGFDDNLEVVVTAAVGTNLVTAEGGKLNLPIGWADPPIGPSVSGMRLVNVTQQGIQHRWYTFEELDRVYGRAACSQAAACG